MDKANVLKLGKSKVTISRVKKALVMLIATGMLIGGTVYPGGNGRVYAANEGDWPEVQSIISPYVGTWMAPPTNVVVGNMTQGAIIGNGNLGIVAGGTTTGQKFYISKGDFITSSSASPISSTPITIGGINVREEGLINLALGKTATATDVYVANPTSNAVDESFGTFWASNLWQSPTDYKWLTVDLGQSQSIQRWVVGHAGGAATTRDFKLQRSTGDINGPWVDVDAVTGNTKEITARNVGAFTAQYVRIYITNPVQSGANYARISEFQLYSEPSPGSSDYSLEQDILNAEVRTTLTNGIKMRSWIADTEDSFITEVWTDGSNPIDVAVDTWTKSDISYYPSSAGNDSSTLWATRETNQSGNWISRAAIATKILGAAYTTSSSGSVATASFTLQPGTTVKIVSNVGGGKNSTSHLTDAKTRVAQLDDTAVASLKAGHLDWWKQYWLKSYVKLNEPTLEKYYYGALYEMASASRDNSAAAPGLYGIWITTDGPYWSNDTHLNYNGEAPFYGVFSSNRSELITPYIKAVTDFVPEGQRRAQNEMNLVNAGLTSKAGILYPVGIQSWGAAGAGSDKYLMQVSDASFAGIGLMDKYDYSQDTTYLSTVAYPYVKLLADFWVSYLKEVKDLNGNIIRYDTYGSIMEDYKWAKNPIFDLALVQRVMKFCLNAVSVLNINEPQSTKWQDILAKLAPFPLTTSNGKTVYAWDNGTDTNPLDKTYVTSGGLIGLQIVYPAEAIGLNSDSGALQIAKDSFADNNAWNDLQAMAYRYIIGYRIGYDPTILRNTMIGAINGTLQKNLVITDIYHGLEKAGNIEAINSSLLMSQDNVITLFNGMVPNSSAKFKRLRAKGAFLIDGEMINGTVATASIYSEQGKVCTVNNPWPGQQMTVTESGNPVATTNVGEKYTFNTVAGKTYKLSPPTLTVTTGSSFFQNNLTYAISNATDGTTATEWASNGELNPWINVEWSPNRTINRVVLNDRANLTDNANGGTLTFSDGSTINVTGIPTNGTSKVVTFPAKNVTSVKFQVSGGSGLNVGLSEFKAYYDTTPFATASSYYQNNAAYAPSVAIDGNTATEWASSGELNPWINVDLGTTQSINTVALYDRANTTDNVNGGTLTFSDGSTITVTGIPTNGAPKVITFPAKSVTSVMFQVSGGSGYNVGLTEFNAYYDSAPNVALNKTVTSYSSQVDLTTWKASNINDGVVNSTSRGWASASGSGVRNEWVTMDLGQSYNLSSFTIQNEDVADDRNVKDYILYGSATGAFAGEEFVISSGTIPSLLHMAMYSVNFTPAQARYIKFKGTSSYSNYVIVGELSLYGQ